LENHHCATGFDILKRPECNFTRSLETTQWHLFRNSVVDMVLATDLSQHLTVLSLFKKKVSF
jgi:hypothetical protein